MMSALHWQMWAECHRREQRRQRLAEFKAVLLEAALWTTGAMVFVVSGSAAVVLLGIGVPS